MDYVLECVALATQLSLLSSFQWHEYRNKGTFQNFNYNLSFSLKLKHDNRNVDLCLLAAWILKCCCVKPHECISCFLTLLNIWVYYTNFNGNLKQRFCYKNWLPYYSLKSFVCLRLETNSLTDFVKIFKTFNDEWFKIISSVNWCINFIFSHGCSPRYFV